MNRADYRELLDEYFDRREDPLDDERIQQHLAEHPEDLEAFAALRAMLGGLEPEPVPALRFPVARRWPFWLAAGLLLTGGGLGLVLQRPAGPAGPATPEFRVLASSLTEHTAPCVAALSYCTREVLVQTDTTRLEIVERHSILR